MASRHRKAQAAPTTTTTAAVTMLGHRVRATAAGRELVGMQRSVTIALDDPPYTRSNSFNGFADGGQPLMHSRSEGAATLLLPSINAELFERAQRIKDAASEELNSVTATVFQITNSMLGAGILAFPYHLAGVGSVVTLFTFAMLGSCMWYTMVMMIECGHKRQIYDYALIVEDVLGRRMAKWLDFSIGLCCMGNIMSYINVIGDMGADVMREWAHHKNIFVDTYAGFIIVFLLVVEFPFIFYRNYGDITWLSYFSLFLIACVITVFVGWEGQVENDGGFKVPSHFPPSISPVLSQLGTWSYAYAIQYATFEAYVAMSPDAKKKWPLTVGLCVGFGAVLLLLMAYLGYGAFGEDCEADILTNFDTNKWEVQVGKLAVVIHLLSNMPNDFVLMRLFSLRAFDLDVGDLDTPRFMAASIFIFAVPLILMAAIPAGDVGGAFLLIINLTGDIPTAFACFVVPALMWLRIFEGDRSRKFYTAVFVLALGVFMMLVCSVHDIVSFLIHCADDGCKSYA